MGDAASVGAAHKFRFAERMPALGVRRDKVALSSDSENGIAEDLQIRRIAAESTSKSPRRRRPLALRPRPSRRSLMLSPSGVLDVPPAACPLQCRLNALISLNSQARSSAFPPDAPRHTPTRHLTSDLLRVGPSSPCPARASPGIGVRRPRPAADPGPRQGPACRASEDPTTSLAAWIGKAYSFAPALGHSAQ